MDQSYCMKCMQPNGGTEVSPHCGYVAGETSLAPHILRPGTILHDRYLLGEPIGQGGFGITYIGRDLNLNMRVAVKEYYPNGCANRNVEVSNHISITSDQTRVAEGKNRFLTEAQVLARFHDTPGVVDVRDYFRLKNRTLAKVLAEAITPAYFVPATLKADVLFRQMIGKLLIDNGKSALHMAVSFFDAHVKGIGSNSCTISKRHHTIFHKDTAPHHVQGIPMRKYSFHHLMFGIDGLTCSLFLLPYRCETTAFIKQFRGEWAIFEIRMLRTKTVDMVTFGFELSTMQ